MWLVVMFAAAFIASIIYFLFKKYRTKYKLGLLILMLWGASIMVFVDHIIAFFKGEPFIQFTTDGLIKNATLLGIVMLIPILLIWLFAILYRKQQKE